MTTVTLSENYEITLPISICTEMGIKPGQELKIFTYNKHIELIPVIPIQEAYGMFPNMDTMIEREQEDRV